MPSSDETFFPIQRLHRLFAVSALCLLAVTLWVIAADHYRPWKAYQRRFRDEIEPAITQTQIGNQQADEFRRRDAQLVQAVDDACRAVPQRALVARFAEAVSGDVARRKERAADLAPLWAAYDALSARPSAAARDLLVGRLDALVNAARLRQANFERQLRFRRAEFDQQRSRYDAAVGQGRPQSELAQRQLALRGLKDGMAVLAAQVDEAAVHCQSLSAVLVELRRDEQSARRALAEHRASAERLARQLVQQQPNWGKWLLRLPLLDAFGRPLSVQQTWLPELTINYNFRQVPRFDRCTTCHLGIDRADSGMPSAANWSRLPQPFASHPRLDLFVGPHSPHPLEQFGCTICHDGQGSATDFTCAAHSPNDPAQRADWRWRYGWTAQANWDYPMLPRRFAESRCLKCHHDVTDLEPSPRFPDPPAAKLLAGYNLVRQYGCFGCHAIQGFDASRRLGPDMRLEPSVLPGQTSQSRGKPPVAPGTMRKVGPSLRDIAEWADAGLVENWIRHPAGVRSATRMPQLYGLHEHLQGQELSNARRFEAVEVRAIGQYLLGASRPLKPQDVPPGVGEAASPERGKRLFQTVGCSACHRHREFPDRQPTQGPDLTNLGAQITTTTGRAWLTDWIRDPSRHGSRTTMPNMLLQPIALDEKDPTRPGAGQGGARGSRLTDPAADIAAWLLASHDWRAEPSPPLCEADLDALTLQYLRARYPASTAAEYLARGIPQSPAGRIAGDEELLLGPPSTEKKLRYVGRRTIRRRGCFGCHDIAGVEDAVAIGPELTDWGRKPVEQLAFEQIDAFVEKFGIRNSEGGVPIESRLGSATGVPRAACLPVPACTGGQAASGTRSSINTGRNNCDVRGTPSDFFPAALLAHRREGFIWQKLREPRSFDYQKTQNKGYLEQLTMGHFTLSDSQREAIATFILGLVAEPPREKYVYHADRRQQAIVAGRKLLEQFACAECHTLAMERWTIQYEPAKFKVPPQPAGFDFLKQHADVQTPAESPASDRPGLAEAELVGMPRLDAQGQLQQDEDDDGNPLYGFSLWEPVAVGSQVWPVGGGEVPVSKPQIVRKCPPLGGDLARWLYPVVLRDAKAAGSAAPQAEAWGWLPPALVHEGRRVQPAWLYDYLLSPRVIRPAAVLRMPRFNLAPADASTLADYFAAVDGVEFPYVSTAAARPADTEQQPSRRNDAMRLVLDRKTYCAKCHLVGDYSPDGENRTVLAPNLAQVGRRIRPEYLRRWLGDPKSVLPYTPMPVNFPPSGAPLGQDLLRGSSVEQLDAVTDFLLNYGK